VGVFFVFIVLAAVVGGAAYVLQFKARQARVAAVSALAQRIGFSFSNDDVEHVVGMPFALFSKGDGRRVELVISGTHSGLPMRMFDYWYYDQTSDGRGGQSRTYHRFTCALATIPAACPRLRVGHEDFLTRLGDHLGLGDVELEYDDFNQRFRVKCDDQKFAFSLLDGKMMQWLLGADTFDSFEVDGPWILLVRAKLEPAQWLDLGAWLDRFHRQIPPVVYSTFPPR
jgi:hypothetical protein